ncbi:MAG: prolipoprotein diacylglyceryl transferase, partial [candidate division Zixibacteria bacterium]|nr:prolipoprotein diacylglyceryl transferase [candidate division Zixibacteria bacterium]
RSYGVMLALSFLVGIYLALKRSAERGLDQNQMVNLSLLVILFSIVGARIMYVIPHWDEFSSNLLDIVSPFQSSGIIGLTGLTMYGGFIGAVVAALIYLKRNRLPIWRACDAFTPSIALGIGFTRIGCLLNGCCFGKPTDLPWGVTFPAYSAAGSFYPDAHLHPSQLYNAVLGFGLFALLMWLDRKERFDGFLFAMLLIIEPMTRFVVDFSRYYESSMTLAVIGHAPFSVNQGVSLVLCGIGFFLIGRLRNEALRKKTRKPAQPRKNVSSPERV